MYVAFYCCRCVRPSSYVCSVAVLRDLSIVKKSEKHPVFCFVTVRRGPLVIGLTNKGTHNHSIQLSETYNHKIWRSIDFTEQERHG